MSEHKRMTPWHPLFGAILAYAYRDRSIVHSEYPLTGWPLRGDVLLIEKGPAVGGAGPLPRLPAIGQNLGARYTLLELKGPTDTLERFDLPQLIAYCGLLEVKEQIEDPDDLHLIVVASGLAPAFTRRTERASGHFVQRDRGQYLVDGLMYRTFFIDAAAASETAGNGLLYAFSREHLSDPGRLSSRMSPADRDLYAELCHHIQQLKRSETTMQMKDSDVFNRTADELLREVVARMPPEERLRGLAPEVLAQRLSPEERLRGLTPEERLRGLTPEQLLALEQLLQQQHRR